MKTRKANTTARPLYPTRLEVLSHPDLLRRNAPASWMKSREMASAALILMAMSLSACPEKKTGNPTGKTTVAPVFEHGDGRGVMGCVVINPPVFLSEEEARSIIVEELKAHGISITDEDEKWSGVEFPSRAMKLITENGKTREEVTDVPGEKHTLRVDGVDPDKKVAYEFVSVRDYRELGGPASNSTVQGYDLLGAAREVRDRVEKDGPGLYFAALYDPTFSARGEPALANCKDIADHSEEYACWSKEAQKVEAKVAAEVCASGRNYKDDSECRYKVDDRIRELDRAGSEKQLRQQVNDFVDWLKAQGAL